MSRIWKLLANYKDILAIAADVKVALEDKTISQAEALKITKELIDLLAKLGLIK